MKLGTIIAIIIALAGCGLVGTQMMSVGVPREDLERAKKAMQDAEKSARVERQYPAPAHPRPAPMPAPAEPVGSGSSRPSVQPNLATKKPADTVSKQLFSANLAFAVRDRANIDDDIKAQLLINPGRELADLEKDLTVRGNKTSKKIQVSRVVRATLTAPDFQVTNITDEEQVLADTESTEWLWVLKPKTSGTHEINLSVTAVVKVDGRESKHHLKTFDKTIVVEITKQQVVENWFEENWKWVISTLIIPLLIFLFKERVKKLLGIG